MILGRPVNLWLAAFTAVLNVLVLLSIVVLDALQLAGINIAAAAVIGLVANSTPTVKAGSEINVVTPADEPNYTTTV